MGPAGVVGRKRRLRWKNLAVRPLGQHLQRGKELEPLGGTLLQWPGREGELPAGALRAVEGGAAQLERLAAQGLLGKSLVPAEERRADGGRDRRAEPRRARAGTLRRAAGPDGFAGGAVAHAAASGAGERCQRPAAAGEAAAAGRTDPPGLRAEGIPGRCVERAGRKRRRTRLHDLLSRRGREKLEAAQGKARAEVLLLGHQHDARRRLLLEDRGVGRPLEPPRRRAYGRARAPPPRSG